MGERDDRRGAHNPIRFRTCFRNTIYDALRERGWKETDADAQEGWDIHWTDRDMMFEVFDTTHLESWQRVNHYRCKAWAITPLMYTNDSHVP
jgi:tubulin polyglutamylase TTLL9